jgi:hypothetical protein
MYVIHLRWEDFLECAEGGTTFYLDYYLRYHNHSGIEVGAKTCMVVGYYTDEVHTVRIPVEQVSLLTEDRQVPPQVYARREQAARLVEASIHRHCKLATVRRGVLLVPGLRDDIERYETSHDLWNWQGDLKDPRTRTLVAAEVSL